MSNSSSSSSSAAAAEHSAAQNLLELDVDGEVDRAVERVRQGTHASLVAQAGVLEQERRKLVEAAQRHKDMQMLNVQQLFDYEVQDAQALYEVRSLSAACFSMVFFKRHCGDMYMCAARLRRFAGAPD